MKLVIMSVLDKASSAYGRPVFALSRGEALRSFMDEVNNARPENLMYKYPGDFELYMLGGFDTDTAEFSLLPRPDLVARAFDLRQEATAPAS